MVNVRTEQFCKNIVNIDRIFDAKTSRELFCFIIFEEQVKRGRMKFSFEYKDHPNARIHIPLECYYVIIDNTLMEPDSLKETYHKHIEIMMCIKIFCCTNNEFKIGLVLNKLNR